MNTVLRTFICGVSGMLCCAGISAQQADTSATAVLKAEQPTLDEFREWADNFVAQPNTDILLPEDWFHNQFDAELAEKLSAEYRNVAKGISGVEGLIAAQKQKGNTELQVDRCDQAIDRNATGLQNAALQHMKSATPLFTIRLTKPGEPRGFTLSSFVKVDGKFCFAGKMAALNTNTDDIATNVLCTTPLAMMEKVLQEKGLIESSAEAYLKKVGVLK